MPLYEYTTFCLSIHLLIGTWILFTFWLLWLELLWAFVSKYLFEPLFSSFAYMPRCGIAVSNGYFIFSLLKNFQYPFCNVTYMILLLIIKYLPFFPRANWLVTWVRAKSLQLCPTLCNPMHCSLPGSSVHGILQARVLEWVAISFSRVSSRPRDQTRVFHIAGRRFTIWATREARFWVYWAIIWQLLLCVLLKLSLSSRQSSDSLT